MEVSFFKIIFGHMTGQWSWWSSSSVPSWEPGSLLSNWSVQVCFLSCCTLLHLYSCFLTHVKMRILKFWIPRCIFRHPRASELEEWISTKDYSYDERPMGPKWHIPSDEEVHFANELLDLHLKSALDDLLTMCQSKIHSEPGNTVIPQDNFSLNLTNVVVK